MALGSTSSTSIGGPVTANLETGTATGEGSDTFVDSFEGLIGSDFGDVLTGDGSANFIVGRSGNDTISGGGGADRLTGDAGDDTLVGGGGDDTIFYDFPRTGIRANLARGTVTGDGSDRVREIENVEGSPFADVIVGNGTRNWLQGFGGNDTLSGGAGPDRLDGNEGNDDLRGDAGNDRLDGGSGRNREDGGRGSDRCVNAEHKIRCP